MSWTPEAIVISGYKVPREIWCEGFEFCESLDSKENKNEFPIPEDWEDYFIDMDAPGGDDTETFFGSIIYTVPEDGHTKEFDTILANFNTIDTVQTAFHKIFDHLYMMRGWPLPQYNKYLGCRWV